MKNFGLHRYAVAVASCTLLVIAAGATVTTQGAGLSIPDWPLAYGHLLPSVPGFWGQTGAVHAWAHRLVAAISVLMMAGLAVWTYLDRASRWLRVLASCAVGLFLIQAVSGAGVVLLVLPRWLTVVHASVAHLCLGVAASLVVFTSPAIARAPELVRDYGWPTLRSLAVATPVLVFAQVVLGALYRHRVLSLIPHVVGAMVVGTGILLNSLFVLTQFPQHSILKRVSTGVLLMLIVQLTLGVFTYMSGASAGEQPRPDSLTALFTILHVIGGSLLFVLSVTLGIQVRRHVLPRFAPAENTQAAS